MRTFLFPGPAAQFELLKFNKNHSIAGVLIQCESEKLNQLQGQYYKHRIWNLKQLRTPLSGVEEISVGRTYELVLHKLMSDSRTFYLAERVLGNNLWNSVFNHTVIIDILIRNSLHIIQDTQPDCLLMCASPHSIETWVLSICFEVVGLKVYIMESSPLLWRTWLYEGIDAQRVVKLEQSQRGGPCVSNWTNQFIKSQRSTVRSGLTSGRPKVELLSSLSQSILYKGRWWSWRRELSRALRKNKMLPENLAELWLKKKLLNSYESLAVKNYPSAPFVTFFMHYQPERSSLPEGLGFAQQWLAIRALADGLPSGWVLLVREHPSTWWRPLKAKVRTPNLYNQIAEIPNVKIASMDLSTFGLIDHSVAVSTLTGKVGFQSILRNKPTIFFGVPSYKEAPAAFFVRGVTDVQEVISKIEQGNAILPNHKSLVEDYLLWVEKNTVTCKSGLDEDGDVETFVGEGISDCRYAGFRIIMEWFLSLNDPPELAKFDSNSLKSM